MKIASFGFHLRPKNVLYLPKFKGSTFRGTFGRVLKKSICVIKNTDCRKCILSERCAYPYLFETSDEDHTPMLRPYVFQIPDFKNEYGADEILKVGLVLYGKAIQYISYFVYSFQLMGERGVGKERHRFELEQVTYEHVIYPPEIIFSLSTNKLRTNLPGFTLQDIPSRAVRALTIQLVTPVQLRKNGKPANRIDFPLFYQSLERRYRRLQAVHGEYPVDLPSYTSEELFAIKSTAADLRLSKFRRYSNRQQKEMFLMGFVGTVRFVGNLEKFYPLVKLGEFLHVGKNVVFGLGQYRILEEE